MTNANDGKINLGLHLGYSDQSIRTRLDDNSGAGVNADSREDMPFAASDPLSELVWSPHKGLSLKCADCSLTENKPFLLWNVGPSSGVNSLSQSIRSECESSEKVIDGCKFIVSVPMFKPTAKFTEGTSLANSPQSRAGPQIEHRNDCQIESLNQRILSKDFIKVDKASCSPDDIQKGQKSFLMTDDVEEGSVDSKLDTALLSTKVKEEKFRKAEAGMKGSVEKCQMRGEGFASVVNFHVGRKQSEAHFGAVRNASRVEVYQEEVSLDINEDNETKRKTDVSDRLQTPQNQEFTAENDIQHFTIRGICAKSEESPGRKDDMLENSLTNRRISLYQQKGKAKAMSDGDTHLTMCDDEEESHESVESRNSGGLFSRGRKRWSFEEQLIRERKKIKRQDELSHGSQSVAGRGSSFMNWISNIVKGFSNQDEDDAPSLALTLAHTGNSLETSHHEIILPTKTHDSGSNNRGFRTMFQSLYSLSTITPGIKVSEIGDLVEDCKDIVPTEKALVEIPQGSCLVGKEICSKQAPISHKEINPWTLCNDKGLTGQAGALSASIARNENTCKINTEKDRSLSNLLCNRANDELVSSDSQNKLFSESKEKFQVNSLPERKAVHGSSDQFFPSGSSWITRLSSKVPSVAQNVVYAADPVSLKPASHMSSDHLIDQKSADARDCYSNLFSEFEHKDLQSFDTNSETVLGFKDAHGCNPQRSIVKLNPILPSPRFKSSEVMASTFARRLDALKHSIPSVSKFDKTSAVITCFLCGRTGHDLKECSELAEAELGCATGSSSRQQQSGQADYSIEHIEMQDLQFNVKNGGYSSSCKTKDEKCKVAYHTLLNEGETKRTANLYDTMDSGKGPSGSTSNEIQKHHISELGGYDREVNHMLPLFSFSSKQITDVPNPIFDAMRRIQLSRVDILKWMNSQGSLSDLDGFFLRLRIGKWEAGLGETGYHVACIIGDRGGEYEKDIRNQIFVNVGGIRCLVDNKYISNHHFSEDELVAWWDKMLKGGDKVPSEGYLKLKFEERIRLGF